MKIYFATDHAGFELKEELLPFVRDELGYAIEDFGAFEHDPTDDYPDFIAKAAQAVSKTGERAIIFGASGQGEAIVANRFPGIRAVVYYGEASSSQNDAAGNTLDIVASTRAHNDANVLSIGARFVNIEEAKKAVQIWLSTEFSEEERHKRRLEKVSSLHTE